MQGRDRRELGGTITASWTLRAVDYCRRRGLDAEALLASLSLSSEALSLPQARITFQQHVDFLEEIARRLADPGVGVDIGSTGKPEDFGAMGLLAETSASLRDALDMVQKFNPLANQASSPCYWTEGERVYISDAHLPDGRPAPRVAAEATMSFYARTIIATTGWAHQWRPRTSQAPALHPPSPRQRSAACPAGLALGPCCPREAPLPHRYSPRQEQRNT